MYFYGWIQHKSKNFPQPWKNKIMNKTIIRDEIKWLLEAINEQYAAIQGHGEKIPQIEFDILMENVRKFYQDMHLLQRMNEQVILPESKGKVNSGEEPLPVSTPEQSDNYRDPEPQPVTPPPGRVTVTFSDPEPEEPAEAEVSETDDMPFQPSPVQFKPAGPPPGRAESAPTSRKSVKLPEIDLFASEEPTFSIKLKNAREQSLGPKVSSDRIDNLKTAISINEKFMFINELFEGNLREYNETIETLNGFKTMDQAADFLDLLRKKNFWNTGSNAFKKLKDLVERRF